MILQLDGYFIIDGNRSKRIQTIIGRGCHDSQSFIALAS